MFKLFTNNLKKNPEHFMMKTNFIIVTEISKILLMSLKKFKEKRIFLNSLSFLVIIDSPCHENRYHRPQCFSFTIEIICRYSLQLLIYRIPDEFLEQQQNNFDFGKKNFLLNVRKPITHFCLFLYFRFIYFSNSVTCSL